MEYMVSLQIFLSNKSLLANFATVRFDLLVHESDVHLQPGFAVEAFAAMAASEAVLQSVMEEMGSKTSSLHKLLATVMATVGLGLLMSKPVTPKSAAYPEPCATI